MEFGEDINKKMMEIKNKKSHENFGVFAKMKKSVAFFQANPWLGNSIKSRKSKEIKLNVIGGINATEPVVIGSANITTEANGDVNVW